MKIYIIVAIFLSLFGCTPKTDEVKKETVSEPVYCNTFDIDNSIDDDTLTIRLDTDLPNETMIEIYVFRYCTAEESQDQFPVSYWKGLVSVNDLVSKPLQIDIRDEILYENKYGWTIDWCDDSIEVHYLVSNRLEGNDFIEGDRTLQGEKVTENTYANVILEVEQLEKPIKTN